MNIRLAVALSFALASGTSIAGAFLAPLSGAAIAARPVGAGGRRSLFLSDRPLDDGGGSPSLSAFGGSAGPRPKRSLELLGQAHTARPWLLNLVAALHWLPLLPALAASYSVLAHVPVWDAYLGGGDLRTLAWLLAPLVMFAAALPDITMHIYEDWQIAPTRDPAAESFRHEDFNNDRLRCVTSNMLFWGITAANFATVFGYFGSVAILPFLGLTAASSTLKGGLDEVMPKEFPDRHLVTPTPLGVSAMMALSTTVAMWILHDVGDHIPDGHLLAKVAVSAALPLISIGGVYEGIVGETKFNQWDHLLAGSFILAGNCAYALAFYEIGKVGLS